MIESLCRGLTRNTYFRCRVDFRDAPSSNSFVRLTVIVQPRQVAIFDEAGTERNTFVGPYLEGDSMNVFCQAIGGEFATASLYAIRIGNEKWWPIHIAWIVCFWPKKESEMDKLWPWWPTLSEKSGLWKKGALPGSPRYRLSDDLYIFYCNLLPPFVVCHYESWCTSWLPDLHIFCNLSIL